MNKILIPCVGRSVHRTHFSFKAKEILRPIIKINDVKSKNVNTDDQVCI